jgi:hypothetical protein
VSNIVPFALLDVLILAVASWTVWGIIRGIRGPGPWRTLVGRWLLNMATIAAALYVSFALCWGLNYRRPPLAARLESIPSRASDAAAIQLAREAVIQLNDGYAAAHAERAAVDGTLPGAFHETLQLLGLPHSIVPGRPKRSLLDPYYKAASVSGMTDPFFLEILIASDLLPVERPFTIAHEWSHLAGINDEGEANFVAFLTGMRGSAAVRYSAWLFMYMEVLSSLPRDVRADISSTLATGPRDDLRDIAERQRRNVRPRVANAGWQVYDTYLKANRVEAGARSYREVVRLVLETRFAPEWVPVAK